LFKSLDPELRKIFFYDNLRPKNDALVFYLHGLGLDQDDFYQVLLETKYRSIAPSLYGFHPNDSNPLSLPLEAHRHIIARFIETKIAEIKPRKVVLVGFSTGADLLRDLGAISIDPKLLCGVLLLDTNINRETCFISRELRRALDEDLSAIQLAQSIGSAATDISDWLDLHRYLVKVLGKYRGNLRHLARFAASICDEHSSARIDQFTERYKACLSLVANSLFLFSKGDVHEALISNINSCLLSENDSRRCIAWERETSHFGLIEANFLERNVGGILAHRGSKGAAKEAKHV